MNVFKTFLFLLAVANTLVAQEPASWFVTKDHKPTRELQALLELDGLYDPNDSLEQIIQKTQKNWLQVNQGPKERTDLLDSDAQKKMRQKVENILEKMGYFNAKNPAQKHYTYAAVYGAFIDATRASFAYILDCWDKGIRFDSIVVFTGNRALRKAPGQEDDPAKLKMPLGNAPYETEYDMCKRIWEELKRPEIPIYFVNAKGANDALRPSRKDCYLEWLKTNPKPGSILASSHPLYWHFQQLSVENVLPTGFTVDTCCNEASVQMRQQYNNRLVSVIHDNIAKCLFEIGKK
ncbi:MAG: hypothetical protein LLF94_01780 [Chlamydiales bacterium]|nr:hypothetical protein [Chlamydiales bacterium]